MRKIIAILLALTMVAAIGAAAFPDDVSELPRNETLYFAGQQWGTVLSWNIIGTNQNNSMAIAGGASGYRTLMFETLFMYNFMNGDIIGLLADSYEWNDDLTEDSVVLKDAAKWCDGTPVTAADVVKTWDVGVQIGNGTGATFGAYIDSIEATGDKTFVIKSKLTDHFLRKLETSNLIKNCVLVLGVFCSPVDAALFKSVSISFLKDTL